MSSLMSSLMTFRFESVDESFTSLSWIEWAFIESIFLTYLTAVHSIHKLLFSVTSVSHFFCLNSVYYTYIV